MSTLGLSRQSYDVEVFLQIDGTTISAKNILDLKNPYFRFAFLRSFATRTLMPRSRYPSQPVQVPPGQHHESPTDQYWNALPNEQALLPGGNQHPNSNPYSQNCNSNNNFNAGGDYDGMSMDTFNWRETHY